MSKLDTGIAAAQKLLGTAGKIPKPRADPTAAVDAANKAVDALNKTKDDLEDKVLDLQNAYAKVKLVFKQYSDMIEGSTFGLDAKDPDNKKKIDAAAKLIQDPLEDAMDVCTKSTDNLEKLDKILTGAKQLEDLDI